MRLTSRYLLLVMGSVQLWDGPNGTNSTNLETEHHKMFLKTNNVDIMVGFASSFHLVNSS